MESTTAPGALARRAEPAESAAVAAVYLAAFTDEVVLSWVIPDEEQRRAVAAGLFEAELGMAVTAGEVVVAQGPDGTLAGGSAWARADDAARFRAEAEQAAANAHDDEPVSVRMAAVARLTAAVHPDEPHLFLVSMAVLPARRGAGLGAAMLRFGLAEADEAGLPVYLEASTARSRALYLRHGFADAGVPIELPDGGPLLFPMRRSPA